MNKQQIKGMTNRATGQVKQEVGRLTGDSSTVARGQAREIKGNVQQGIGDAKEAVQKDQPSTRRRS
jgi:uncharacterized protein YjbJ (UPF0337 family)